MIRTALHTASAGLAALAASFAMLLAVCDGPASASPTSVSPTSVSPASAGPASVSPATPSPSLLSSYPAANQVLGHSPPSVILQPTAPIDPRESRTVVYDANDNAVASGQLATAMPKLATGVYTVVWSLGDRGRSAQTGSYAFDVASAPAPPALVARTAPPTVLTPVSQAIPRWLAFVFVMTLIGALALRVVVTRPAIRRLPADEQPAIGRSTDRALLVFAAAAVARSRDRPGCGGSSSSWPA
jgi:methionine-rich copper-binding protein CopC